MRNCSEFKGAATEMGKVIIKRKKTVFSEYRIRKEIVSKKVQGNYSPDKVPGEGN